MTSTDVAWQSFDRAEEYFATNLLYIPEVCKIIISYYRRHFGNAKIQFMIDCACGSGRLSERLANECHEVLAFDLSPQQIQVGIRNSNHPHVTYKVSSVYDMSKLIDEQHARADLVTCNASSHYFNNSRFYDQVRKCLRVGGILAESGGLFDRFLECGEEEYEAVRDMWKKTVTNNWSNPDYSPKFQIYDSRYRALEVFLENAEIVDTHCDVVMTVEQFLETMIYCYSIKSAERRDEAESFCLALWKKYSKDGLHLTARYTAFVAFSRNMTED